MGRNTDTQGRILDFLKENCGESYTAVDINVEAFNGDPAFHGVPGDVPISEIRSVLQSLADGGMVKQDGIRMQGRPVRWPGATTSSIESKEPTYSVACENG